MDNNFVQTDRRAEPSVHDRGQQRSGDCDANERVDTAPRNGKRNAYARRSRNKEA
tara:strand:+ start:311 stop:475 length:165 start_codon:yes stop_codon:yes gene_type:complete